MKRFIAIAAGIAAALSLTASVASAAPTGTSTVTIEPQGSLYKDVKKPVNISLGAKLTPAPGDQFMTPLLAANFKLPKDLAFVPDAKMPACDLISEANSNFPPDTAKAICPDSIIGDGTAGLYFAQNVDSLIDDPVITIFSGGKAADGGGILAIQAWSTVTNHGIFMSGQLKNGQLDVDIPRLTGDSSVPYFTLNIPGAIGQDKGYAEASCSTGTYTTDATFDLGKRNEANVVSDQSTLDTPSSTATCKGLAGKAKLSLKVKAPKKVKSGKKGTFKVTVTNKGTGSGKNIKISASGAGKGSANAGTIKPGKSKTVKVKVKVKGKKGKKVTVKFKASGNAKASGSAKVKVG